MQAALCPSYRHVRPAPSAEHAFDDLQDVVVGKRNIPLIGSTDLGMTHLPIQRDVESPHSATVSGVQESLQA
jgi:hypothetical protein